MSFPGPENLPKIGEGSPERAGGYTEAAGPGCSGEDYEELNRFLEAAVRQLKSSDLTGAELLLKKASVRATSMWIASGDPSLPQPLTDLDEFRENLRRLEYQRRRPAPHPLVEVLEDVRSQFENHPYFGAGRWTETERMSRERQ